MIRYTRKVMKKEYLAAVIILAVIGVVLFVAIGRNQTSVKPSVAPADSIVYTNSGYSPTEFTVQAGTTVIFVNQSDLSMWTASDPHPVHTEYAKFDHRQGIGKDETYEFTFTEPGTYNYHNHLFPQHTGTITVE